MVDVGDRARSREGHAAMSMRGGDNRWIEIQNNTFRNWINEQLRPVDESVNDLEVDFDTGVRLCALMECLRGKKVGRVIKKPMNPHQYLENVTLALKAMQDDKIKLVNIGSEDIVNGNIKLILGMVWHLILRYQIGKTKFPPKKLMLAWLQAVIPDCNISNFSRDWNDGIALNALLDYCQPGLSPNWRNLSRSDRLENCRHAMELANQHFGIPLVVRPEDLASPDMDELSGMTYLSYFMKLDSPGYNATLRWVRDANQHGSVNNFTTDWADGYVLCSLVNSLGGNIPGWPNIDRSDPVAATQLGIDGARGLSIEPVLTAEEMVDSQGEHLGVMAYAAYFQRCSPVKNVAEAVSLSVDLNNVRVGHPTSFRLNVNDNELESKDLRVEVSGPSGKIPCSFDYHNQIADGTFTAKEPGPHTFTVYCKDNVIRSCPLSFTAIGDRSKVHMGRIDTCLLGALTNIKVDSSAAGDGIVRAEARAPSGQTTELSVKGQNGDYSASFQPSEAGEWEVSMLFDGDHVHGSPFRVNVFDPSAVQVSGLETRSAGQQVALTAECESAGLGELSCDVTHNGEIIPSVIRSIGSGKYTVDFTPRSGGQYRIDTKYAGYPVKGSPHFMVVEDSQSLSASGPGLGLVSVNQETSFDVNGVGSGDLNVEVTAPSGQSVHSKCTKEGQGYKVVYTPPEAGTYIVHVNCNGQSAPGSPFHPKAHDPSKVTITEFVAGGIGKPGSFIVDASQAGEGSMEIAVSANGTNIENRVTAVGRARYLVEFTPTQACAHVASVIYNDVHVPGSPFTMAPQPTTRPDLVQVSGHEVAHTRNAEFLVDTRQAGPGDLVVHVRAPNGEQVPAKILKTPNGEYKVEYSTTHVGRHTIDIYYNGQRIGGSPYFVDVFDPQRVRVEQHTRQAIVNQETGLQVFSQEAGRAELTAMVYSPSGVVVPHQILETANGTRIAYKPTEYGVYKIYAYYGGVEVPGCPIVQEIRANQVNITAHGDGLVMAEEGVPATFYVDSHGAPGDLFVQVGTPNSIAKCNISPEREGYYRVTYTPVECGVYDVQIKWNDKEISGSPYHPQVIDTRRVNVVGGWNSIMDSENRVHLVHNETKRIVMDTSLAGPGSLEVMAVGPGGMPIPVNLQQQSDGKMVIMFTPTQTGEHRLSVLWCKRHIPGSPFLCYCHAVKPAVDHTKVVLTGRGLKEARVGEETEFIIDGSQAGEGSPFVVLNGVKQDIPVYTDILGGDRYRVRYTPEIPGAYLLHIQWSDRAVKESPFKVNVVAMSDSTKVVCSGDGLKMGIMGSEITSVIDTRRAGPGELTAQCMGPSRVAYCELYDHRDGTFTLKVRPQEPGRHMLHIKYGGEFVPGSPYTLKIAAAPDASKVRVKGPGVEHGILATFQSRFLVETQGAGAGQLTVRIRGPRGAFRVEMQRENPKDRSILCRFDPTEVGNYAISVKWSGEDVPGSPFSIQVFDTQDELDDYLSHGEIRGKSFHGHGSVYSDYSHSRRSWNAEI